MDLLVSKGDKLGCKPLILALFQNDSYQPARIAVFSHAPGDSSVPAYHHHQSTLSLLGIDCCDDGVKTG